MPFYNVHGCMFYSVLSHIHVMWLMSIPTDCQDNEELWADEADQLDLLDDELKEVHPELPCNSPASDCPSSRAIVTWVVRFLVLTQARHYIPDAAINALLKFLHVLFVVLGRFSTLAASIASLFPSSIHMLRKELNEPKSVIKFVVCQKCHRLYNFDECVSLSGPNFSNTRTVSICPIP